MTLLIGSEDRRELLMRPRLYLLETYDASPGELEAFAPSDPEDVDIRVVAHIGPDDGVGRDLFHFRLLTQKALARNLNARGFILGNELLIVERFDYKFTHALLSALCDRVQAISWDAVAARLSAYLGWESDPRVPVDLSDY